MISIIPEISDFNVDIPCPCGNKINFTGKHVVNKSWKAHCEQCGLYHEWQSHVVYGLPGPPGPAWLCCRKQGTHPKEKQPAQTWGDVLFGRG